MAENYLETFKSSIDQFLELKTRDYLCYVLSNWSAETFKGMEEDYPFLQSFDGMIISGEVKLVKPDKLIFELAISRFNLEPEETIFIDDNLDNIQTAKSLNFKTIHLINPNRIKEEINNFLY